MKKTRISLVGFLMSFSAFNLPAPKAEAVVLDATPPTIEERLSNLTAKIREQEQQLPEADRLNADQLMARVFADGDDRGWRRSRHSGWIDGRDGDFRNYDPWRNGWRDGHRFFDWND